MHSKLEVSGTLLDIATNETGDALEHEIKSSGALALGVRSFYRSGGYINELYDRGVIKTRKVGFYLRGPKDSVVTFGGEEADKIGQRFKYSAVGLDNSWELYGLENISCGTYVQHTYNSKVRFSAAVPYLRMDTTIVQGIIKELSKNMLTCWIDELSLLVICEKEGISVDDFMDITVSIKGDEFTIPAKELVELV